MTAQSTLARVCSALNKSRARYVVVGAQAVNLWGFTRGTRDIDLLIEATAANARRVLDGLSDLGFQLTRDLDPRKVAAKAVTVIGDLYRVDLMTIAWVVRYAEASKDATVFEIDGVRIPTASIRHLIESKRTGRLQDAADIEALEEIKRRRRGNRQP